MPRYDYRCPDCGATKEVALTYSEKERAGGTYLTLCPPCGGPRVFRQAFRPTPIQFKGAGFYVTDSRDEITRWQFKNLDKD
jgi:putative FmdB family regulatory protein